MNHITSSAHLFINTRPVERAGRMLSIDGTWQEVYVPLLALTPCPLTASLSQQLCQCADSDVIIVVSPTAVEIAMRYAQQLGISPQHWHNVQWIAVGQRTAQTLANYGIIAQTPEIETSEGMFQLPVFSAERLAQLNKVSFWRGQGGREWLMKRLQSAQLHVDNCVLYQRHLPTQTEQDWQAYCAKLKDVQNVNMVVLISSLESWRNWLNINQSQDVARCGYLVLGQRVYDVVQQYLQSLQGTFKKQVYLLANLQAESVMAGLDDVGDKA